MGWNNKKCFRKQKRGKKETKTNETNKTLIMENDGFKLKDISNFIKYSGAKMFNLDESLSNWIFLKES